MRPLRGSTSLPRTSVRERGDGRVLPQKRTSTRKCVDNTVSDYKRRGSRYRARRRAVDILFEAEARDIDPVSIADERAEMALEPQPEVKPVAPYTREIVAGVAVELDKIDEIIERYLSQQWELERIPAVDRQILRVAAWEMLFNLDVPAKAALAQGVELGSEYSTPQASPYINAVLDSILQNLEELRAEATEPDSEVEPDSEPEPDSDDNADITSEEDSEAKPEIYAAEAAEPIAEEQEEQSEPLLEEPGDTGTADELTVEAEATPEENLD